MFENNKKKEEQLGMSLGKAANRLKKSLMFRLVEMLNLNKCYRCSELIESEKDLFMNALNTKRTIPLRGLSYNEALKIIQYGNENLRNKRPKVTKSVEDILMDDSVSKTQVIGIMYDALSTMHRYNGNTITHCLIEAIKDSDIVYEE